MTRPTLAGVTSRLDRVLGIAAVGALSIELLILAAYVAFAPIQLGVRIGRLVTGLPIELTWVVIYLVVVGVLLSLPVVMFVSVSGRLSTGGRACTLQRAALLLCGLVQVYAATVLVGYLIAWDGTGFALEVASALLIACAVILVACARLWSSGPARGPRERLSGTLGLVVAGLAVVAVLGFGTSRCTSIGFSPDAWRDSGLRRGPTTRQLLADRLIRCDTLPGMSKAAVRRLLGAPDRRGAQETPQRAQNWTYRLGPKRALISISGYTEVFHVTFGRRGTVRSVAILE